MRTIYQSLLVSGRPGCARMRVTTINYQTTKKTLLEKEDIKIKERSLGLAEVLTTIVVEVDQESYIIEESL